METKDICKLKYLCTEWRGLLQMIVYYVGQGYINYCIVNLPEKKRGKWEIIDRKLIDKYQTAKSMWSKYKAKKEGIMNIVYIRWDHIGLILHTNGICPNGIMYDDAFMDIKKKPLQFDITELTGFCIYIEADGKATVKLSEKTMTGLYYKFECIAAQKNIYNLKKEFDKINGLPAWKGIIKQKRALLKFTLKQAGKHQIKIPENSFRVIDKRYPVKVFTEN